MNTPDSDVLVVTNPLSDVHIVDNPIMDIDTITNPVSDSHAVTTIPCPLSGDQLVVLLISGHV